LTTFSQPQDSPFTQPHLALVASFETELDVRLQDIELRERELAQARAAFESQREQLEAVQAEYEARREALAERDREVEATLVRLRDERARLVTLSMELESRLDGAPPGRISPPVRAAMPISEREWWSKQLGTPLEPA